MLLRTLRVDPSASPAYTLPDALAVDEARDRVYLSTWGPLEPVAGALTLHGKGTLYTLDARTGAVLRTVATGVAPQAIAVAERSGYVVVVNGGGAVRVTDGWAAPWIRRAIGWLPWLGRIVPRTPGVSLAPSDVSVLDAAP